MSRQGQLGLRALKLLAEEAMLDVLRGLAAGAQRPAELERRLPQVEHSMVGRRLHRLLDAGLVTCEHRPGQPPHAGEAPVAPEAHYELNGGGRTLVENLGGAAGWEQDWCSLAELAGPPGAQAVAHTADGHTSAILLALADGSLSSAELDGCETGLGRSALRRRLRELVLAGLLECSDGGRIPLRYELTERARRLAPVAARFGRWEWQCWRPEQSLPGRDLRDLLRMIAPLARVPASIAGVCRLHIDAGGSEHADIYISVRSGRLTVLAEVPAAEPDGTGHATLAAWCDALLGEEAAIAMSGEDALLEAVIEALRTALAG